MSTSCIARCSNPRSDLEKHRKTIKRTPWVPTFGQGRFFAVMVRPPGSWVNAASIALLDLCGSSLQGDAGGQQAFFFSNSFLIVYGLEVPNVGSLHTNDHKWANGTFFCNLLGWGRCKSLDPAKCWIKWRVQKPLTIVSWTVVRIWCASNEFLQGGTKHRWQYFNALYA